MDISLLYFFFPSLSVSTLTIDPHVDFRSYSRYEKRFEKRLPQKRHHQLIELRSIDDQSKSIIWSEKFRCRAELYPISIYGVTAENIRVDFKWSRSSGGSMWYEPVSNFAIESIHIDCTVPVQFGIYWICKEKELK